MNLTRDQREIFSKLGKKGARARRKKHGKGIYSEMGKAGAAKRWAGHKKSGDK